MRQTRRGRKSIKASLFATCTIDQFYPQIGEAVVKVLRRLGVDIDFPESQTCCGQPFFNGGYRNEASQLARHFVDTFSGDNYVIVPSGSCGSMVRSFYPELLKEDPEYLERAQNIASRTYEFSEFLVNVLGVTDVGASFHGKVTYHDSCHLLRELHVADQPRSLIRAVKGADFVEMDDSTSCCGFGGLFSVKYAHISTSIMENKLKAIDASGADAIVANDAGCLMHMSGAMGRMGMRAKPMHLAELLAHGKGGVK